MKCPFCKQDDDKVVDSRAASGGLVIRRRRECLRCNRRYTTYERIEHAPLRVVKKDGRREDFDVAKILAGLKRACEKRPISTETIEQVAAEIEQQIHDMYEEEVPTSEVGKLVMQKLRDLDKVAYVRFASVYREFKDISDFVKEVGPMLPSGESRETNKDAKDSKEHKR